MTKSAASVAHPTRWYEAWWTAITRPIPDAYADLMKRVNQPLRTAYLWVLIAALISGLIRAGVFLYANFSAPIGNPITYIGTIILFSLVVVPMWFTVIAGLRHFSAKLLGGSGRFIDVLYLTAAHNVPVVILSILISLAIPGSISIWILRALNIYQVILGYPTVKAAHNLDTTKSVIAGVVIPGAVLGALYYVSTLPNMPDLFPGG